MESKESTAQSEIVIDLQIQFSALLKLLMDSNFISKFQFSEYHLKEIELFANKYNELLKNKS